MTRYGANAITTMIQQMHGITLTPDQQARLATLLVNDDAEGYAEQAVVCSEPMPDAETLLTHIRQYVEFFTANPAISNKPQYWHGMR